MHRKVKSGVSCHVKLLSTHMFIRAKIDIKRLGFLSFLLCNFFKEKHRQHKPYSLA